MKKVAMKFGGMGHYVPTEEEQHQRLRAQLKDEYERLLLLIHDGTLSEQDYEVKAKLRDLENVRAEWGVKIKHPPRKRRGG